MVSIGPWTRRTSVFSIGFLLLVAAVFAPFGTVGWTYKYEVTQVTADGPHLESRLGWPETTATCHPTDCGLAHAVREEGSRVVSDATYRNTTEFSHEKRLVIFRDADPAFYRMNTTPVDNGGVRVGLEPVSNTTALDLASTTSSRYPSGVRRLISAEIVHTARPLNGIALWEHTDAILAHDGKHYDLGRVTYRTTVLDDVLRFIALALGVALCYYAGRTG